MDLLKFLGIFAFLGILFAVGVEMRRSRKSVKIQTVVSRYSRESQHRIREQIENDSRDSGDLMKMSQELYDLRPDRVLLKRLYEQTVAGKLEWYVGSMPVFFSHTEVRGDNVHFQLRKYIDPAEETWGADMLALTVEVVGTPPIRIERSYNRDEEKNSVSIPLMDLYDYLVEHYPLNPHITYRRSGFLYGAEEITLEKATDIITSV